MLIAETEKFSLDKLRKFLRAFDKLPEDVAVRLTVDETDGRLTIQVSAGNEVSCLGVKKR